jgi:2-oxoisovalerate dehydrogenase E1 component
LTAGFGAEIAAVVAEHAFWSLDAPVVRIAVEDVPVPYNELLLDAVLPSTERIVAAMDRLLSN